MSFDLLAFIRSHISAANLALKVRTRILPTFEIASYDECGPMRQRRPLFRVTILDRAIEITGFLSTMDEIEEYVAKCSSRLPCSVERCGVRVEFYATYCSMGAVEQFFHREALIEGFKSVRRSRV
ncbi:hypothetical protein [Chelatococcus asaccharovorans]|uniref:hypothetical protein n=1 Tax=Chelatococcus asaccharovorans TaxID=28210 RepID=UPI000D76F9DC|nr:hypothetical protein [Chelatococcus asaccharovorans]MBS7704637.1 hypothetical protein [Chelatococcus asaccharovorans]